MRPRGIDETSAQDLSHRTSRNAEPTVTRVDERDLRADVHGIETALRNPLGAEAVEGNRRRDLGAAAEAICDAKNRRINLGGARPLPVADANRRVARTGKRRRGVVEPRPDLTKRRR